MTLSAGTDNLSARRIRLGLYDVPAGWARPFLVPGRRRSVDGGWFRTGEFAEAERLFARRRPWPSEWRQGREALAIGGLGMALHHRNIVKLVNGPRPRTGCGGRRGTDAPRPSHLAGNRRSGGHRPGAVRVGLVFQVLRRDWAAAMPYFWQSFGLAEAVEESGDLYGRSEIHRHLGFYYLVADVRPQEAVRQLGYSLALREKLGDPRRIPSALVALGEAEMAAGQSPARRRAAEPGRGAGPRG